MEKAAQGRRSAQALNLRVIPQPICQETVAELERLLALAQQGELLGMAVVGKFRNRQVQTRVTGVARQQPTLCRGMIAALDDRLSEYQRL